MNTSHATLTAAVLLILALSCGGDSNGADVAASFSFEAFGNENFEKDQPISLNTFEGKPVVLEFLVSLVPPVPT